MSHAAVGCRTWGSALVLLVLLPAAGAVAAEPPTDWPCWRGPNGDGSAPDPGFKLVDDLAKAKLLWKSEEPIPSNAERIDSWRAGYSSPIFADGRVFLFY